MSASILFFHPLSSRQLDFKALTQCVRSAPQLADVVSAAGHEALQTYNWVDSDVFESQVRSEQLRARKEEGETNDKGM